MSGLPDKDSTSKIENDQSKVKKQNRVVFVEVSEKEDQTSYIERSQNVDDSKDS